MFKQGDLKIALIHDWLTGMRGGEKCLEALCELFPQADIYTLMHKRGSVSEPIESKKITTSFLQAIPNICETYRNYLPLFPIAIESFNISKYNLIISTSHCVAKGIKKPKNVYHLCYCFTPMRYAWTFFEDYFGKKDAISKSLIKLLLFDLRRWDLNTNCRINDFVAISSLVQNRIKKFYNRDSQIIFPPVDTEFYNYNDAVKQDFYLIVSAFVPYKRIDLAIKVFNKLKKRLLIVGTGPSIAKLKSISDSKFIEFLGWLSNEEIKSLYQKAKALVFPGEEDFGIVPLEAQGCGTPVIAYNKGGAKETIVPSITGILFDEQTEESLQGAILQFERSINIFKPEQIRLNALRFNRNIFKEEIYKFIMEKYANFITHHA